MVLIQEKNDLTLQLQAVRSPNTERWRATA